MNLGVVDIVPEGLHRKVGWDMRHHFMAEKIMDRFELQLPRDRELVRQLAVIYVLGGLKNPPPEGR
jgi:Zn-finger domain-containing protein